MEVLHITAQCKDGSINTYSCEMPSDGLAKVINDVKVEKDWIGGKLIDAHTIENGEKFVYTVDRFQDLLEE